MRKGGGRKKGSAYERRIAKLFERWWGTKVSRTPLSGGWGNKKEFETCGDLICQGGWPFSIECKCYKKWHLEQLLTGEKCKIKSWWKQSVDDAGHKKIPLLVFTRNHQPNFIMLRVNDWREKLSHQWDTLGPTMEFYMEETNDRVLVMLLSTFIDTCNPPKPSPNRNKKFIVRISKKFKRRYPKQENTDE